MTNPDPNIAFQATVNTTKDEDGDNVYEGLLNAINCPAPQKCSTTTGQTTSNTANTNDTSTSQKHSTTPDY